MSVRKTGKMFTTFVIDLNPSMAKKRIIEEEVPDPTNLARDITVQREITTLEWVLELVITKIGQMILGAAKSERACVITFNGKSGRNLLMDRGAPGVYGGIDELFRPEHPDRSLLDKVRSLQPTKEGEVHPQRGDAIDALIVALSTISDADYSGAQKTATKTIYVITDGMSDISIADSDVIKDKIAKEQFTIKVMGVDFATGGEESLVADRSDAVRLSEKKWKKLLAGMETARILGAERALDSMRYPTVKLTKSVGQDNVLTFGDPGLAKLGRIPEDLLSIPVKVYKKTALARPKNRTEVAKFDRPQGSGGDASAAAGSSIGPGTTADSSKDPFTGENMLSHGVDNVISRIQLHFDKAAVDNHKGGLDGFLETRRADQLSSDVPRMRGYKLGADIVPVDPEEIPKPKLQKGIEILKFCKQKEFQRQYVMGETSLIFAPDTQPVACLQLSAISKALFLRDQYALARFVGSSGSNQQLKLVALFPYCTHEDPEGLSMMELAMANDVRQYTFPPLMCVETADHELRTEHSSIPNEEELEMMGKYIDALDLSEPGGDEDPEDSQAEEDREVESWFDIGTSYSFNVQRVNQAILHKALHPDRPIPSPHPMLTQYMETPPHVSLRRDVLYPEFKRVFNVRDDDTSATTKKRGKVRQSGEPDTDEEEAGESTLASPNLKRVRRDPVGDGDEPEDEEVQSVRRLDDQQPFRLENPLQEFEEDLGNLDNEPVAPLQQLQRTIVHLVRTPDADPELICDCIRRCRAASIDEGEALLWNRFIRQLKDEMLGDDGPQATLWEAHIAQHLDLGLITAEQDTNGNVDDVSSADAKAFM